MERVCGDEAKEGIALKNRKQLLADFYLELLAIPKGQYEPLKRQVLLCLSDELVEHPDTVQRIFERMTEEDK